MRSDFLGWFVRHRFITFSERGPVRVINADAVLADAQQGFFAIADGVGSTLESARASAVAVDSAHNAFLSAGGIAAFARIDLGDLMASAYADYAASFPSTRRVPSSTLTVFLVSGLRLRYVSVGDSPLFWIDENKAFLLTREHTLVDHGKIYSNFSELKSQNGSNILVNTFGRHPPRPILYETVELAAGSWLFACSDGVMEIVTQAELGALSGTAISVEDFSAAIRERASAATPRDNYSAVIIQLDSQGAP